MDLLRAVWRIFYGNAHKVCHVPYNVTFELYLLNLDNKQTSFSPTSTVLILSLLSSRQLPFYCQSLVKQVKCTLQRANTWLCCWSHGKLRVDKPFSSFTFICWFFKRWKLYFASIFLTNTRNLTMESHNLCKTSVFSSKLHCLWHCYRN